MKASTRVLIDLTAPFGESMEVKPILVLKKWMAYRRHRELRVFARTPGIFCITSRYCDLPSSLTLAEIEEHIKPFMDSALERFPGEKWIFDLYVTSKFRVHVVDIAPWNDTASTGLFTWDELDQITETQVRLSDQSFVIPPEDPAVPIEFMDGSSLAEVMQRMNNCRRDVDLMELPDGF
jgi:hypothetical protein